MSATAESVGPMLQRLQEQLVLAGDVQLSRVVGRFRKTWSTARVTEAVREAAAQAEAAKAIAVAGNAVLTVELPLRTISEINTHEHWTKVHKKVGHHRRSVEMAMRAHANARCLKIKPPCSVRLTRIAPDALDVTDNNPAALKHVIDGVADWLGINDRSPTVTWECCQEQRAQYGVRIEVRT